MRKKLSKNIILVTGGAGFIGSAFVRQAAKKGQRIVVIDNLTYAGDKARLKEVWKKIDFHEVDICDEQVVNALVKRVKPHTIVHFAAETHVDRSILDPQPFIETNVRGTQNMIEAAILAKTKRFIHISTDEVYGESKKGKFKESDPLKARNPYSATKASAELIVRAAIETYGLKAVIIRPANNYGPWQYPEKFIPVIMSKALNDERVPVYGRGKQIREWLYVEDCAEAIRFITRRGKLGETYNIGSYHEQNNLTTAKTVLKALDKPASLIKFVKDRPGHDFRYSVDCAKLRRLGWRPRHSFEQGLIETAAWYQDHLEWCNSKD